MNKGKLIVIEGACDGIGKTTQYELLKKYYEDNNIEVSCHHFPSYDTYYGMPSQMYLKGEIGNKEELSPYFINSLYAIDRAIVWNNFLKKDYLDGKTILLDRYTTSSLIYQTALIDDIEEKKKFIDYVVDFEYKKLGIKKPDEVIFLTMDFALASKLRLERKDNEGIINDIHERDLEYMKKVYDNAQFVCDYLKWEKIYCDKDNNMLSIEEIHKNIVNTIKR